MADDIKKTPKELLDFLNTFLGLPFTESRIKLITGISQDMGYVPIVRYGYEKILSNHISNRLNITIINDTITNFTIG